jgi:hypothetical protein
MTGFDRPAFLDKTPRDLFTKLLHFKYQIFTLI